MSRSYNLDTLLRYIVGLYQRLIGNVHRNQAVQAMIFHAVPPTKASPAPLVSTMAFWSMSTTGNMVTVSPVVKTREGS